ncbi:MAG: fimbrial protein [Aeromonadaceae bacterium]
MRLHTLASLLALTALAPTLSQAADGSIAVTGKIVANTCTISSGTAGKHTVTLPTVSTSTLANQNDVAGRTPVTISLTGCTPPTGKVALFFEPGAGTNMANGHLKNTAATGGSNVEVQLLNADLSPIVLNAPKATQNSQEVDLSAGAANLTYFAQYIAATGAATAGDVTANSDFTITYP